MAQSTRKSGGFYLIPVLGSFVALRSMELEKFKEIRNSLCAAHSKVTEGKMMSSPALHYNNKVFAFFSRNKKMVFKLGKEFSQNKVGFELREFSPFKTKKPLPGWFEVDYEHHQDWKPLSQKALQFIKKDN